MCGVTTGFTRMLANGIELIVDGGVREKKQQAGYFQAFGEAYVDTSLTTASVTPRVNVTNNLFGIPNRIIAGIDLYRTDYHSDRSFAQGMPLIHQYSGRQDMAAGYWQQTLGVLPTTDVSFGGRLQHNGTSVHDIYDPTAPQNANFPQGGPLDQTRPTTPPTSASSIDSMAASRCLAGWRAASAFPTSTSESATRRLSLHSRHRRSI